MNGERFDYYNTEIRKAMSKKYVECGEKMSTLSKQINFLSAKMHYEQDILSYRKFNEIVLEKADLEKEYENAKIQRDVWEQAKEICLDVADHM